MDRNSIIGLLIMGALLIGWMFYTAPTQEEIERRKKQQDSISLHTTTQVPSEKNLTTHSHVEDNKLINPETALIPDSTHLELKRNIYGPFAGAIDGIKESFVIENELLKITLSTLGGRITKVELKDYKTSSGEPLILFHPESSGFTTKFVANSRIFSTDSLCFTPSGRNFVVQGKDSSRFSMRLYAGSTDKYLEYEYILAGNSYMIGFNINSVGLQDVLASNLSDYSLEWSMKTPQQEKSIENERQATSIYYKYFEDEVDDFKTTSNEKKSLDAKVRWVALKQQFFTSVLIGENPFEKPADIGISTDENAEYVKSLSAALTIPYRHEMSESFPMKFYFGPLHYKTLKSLGLELEKQVPLGWGIFGWVNRFIVIPIFNFLNGFNLNYGIIILILTLIIKALIFPIAYKTYLSSAKMRILKPEIDEINKKFGNDDPMKKQQATMSLYKKAGVNPLAGCIPLLLQMPILIALFNFFPSSIELRQEGFLWATDLSSYDSILDLPFNIPFYGDHVSLFTLLMTISTIVYTYVNSEMMNTSEQMPGMKMMMYIMPVVFLGIFNNYSSGLSYYYFLANLITISQTFLMRRFVDEKALHKKIQENKKKPVKVSSFQKKLEEMAKQKQQQMRNKK